MVAIFISHDNGTRIAKLVDSGVQVRMYIAVGQQQQRHPDSINKTSVLFVTISFIVLMIISLAWLVFYYIQRFRYAHAKERLSVRMNLYNMDVFLGGWGFMGGRILFSRFFVHSICDVLILSEILRYYEIECILKLVNVRVQPACFL